MLEAWWRRRGRDKGRRGRPHDCGQPPPSTRFSLSHCLRCLPVSSPYPKHLVIDPPHAPSPPSPPAPAIQQAADCVDGWPCVKNASNLLNSVCPGRNSACASHSHHSTTPYTGRCPSEPWPQQRRSRYVLAGPEEGVAGWVEWMGGRGVSSIERNDAAVGKEGRGEVLLQLLQAWLDLALGVLHALALAVGGWRNVPVCLFIGCGRAVWCD